MFLTVYPLSPLVLIFFSGDDGPMVKKPTIDSSVAQLQASSITIPAVGMTDPQLIAQAAIAKYVLYEYVIPSNPTSPQHIHLFY